MSECLESQVEALQKVVHQLREELLSIIYRRLFNIDQAAEYLGIAPKTIRNGLGRKAKDPFPIKPAARGPIRFRKEDLDAYVDSLK